MGDADLAMLDERLAVLRPQLAVECGSGASTRILRVHAARAITLEHLERWAADTEIYCADVGPGELIVAPIVDVGTPAGLLPFYDVELPDGIDFALIDGPPGTIGRSGTLFALWPHLAERAVVWLDDADREAEERALLLWQRHYPIRIERLSSRVVEIVRV
jgi:hypothetical protein